MLFHLCIKMIIFSLNQVKKEAFEKRFKEKQIYEGNKEVQDWLQRMTFDKKGYEYEVLINVDLPSKQ